MILRIAFILGLLSGCKTSGPSGVQSIKTTENERNAMVLRAEVFQGIENPHLLSLEEIQNGPTPPGSKEGKNYFKWNSTVTCNFSEENFTDPPGGQSPKFLCDILDKNGKVVKKGTKIKYDQHNPEVYNEVAGSRLFWILGFPADYYYSVNVVCKGCPESDPWVYVKQMKTFDQAARDAEWAARKTATYAGETRNFTPAAIEKKFGEKIKIAATGESGWSFFDDLIKPSTELSFPTAEQEQKLVEREGLAILAAMLSHVDNQAGNQRLYCLKKDEKEGCKTKAPWMVLHDLGATMGGFRLNWEQRGNFLEVGQASFAMGVWMNKMTTSVFSDNVNCKLTVPTLQDVQTLGPEKLVQVSEKGRRFIMERFVRLSGQKGYVLTDEMKPKIKEQLMKVFLAGKSALYNDTSSAWWADVVLTKLDIVNNYKACK